MSTDSASANTPSGPWAPLGVPVFRAIWLAILTGNVGTWINDMAATWTMTQLSGSPLMIAAMQTATTIPVVFLGLLAGSLADIVDRRKYLLITQWWIFAAASALALIAQSGQLQPWSLLGLTFLIGIGAAMAMPAQAATTSELVSRELLPSAVALGSLSMNISRSVGPALGGLIISQLGVAWAFAINAMSFLVVICVFWRWRREPSKSSLPPETLSGALVAGLRYATQATVFQSVLIRSAAFFIFTSALPALLPIIVSVRLQRNASGYGLLLAFIGIGAVLGALLLPKLRAKINRDRIVQLATLTYAACMLGVALLNDFRLLCGLLVVAGFAWISVLSSLQIAAQTSVPTWVRARALSIYIVTFSSGMATGSLLWGAVAQYQSTETALFVAASGAALGVWLSRKHSLNAAETIDVTPSLHWLEPSGAEHVQNDRGPVRITVEYSIKSENRDAFLALIHQLGRSRRRDGAFQWNVMQDIGPSNIYIESFSLNTWLEHLRQHERVTNDEQRLQQQIMVLQVDGFVPVVRHFIGINRSDAPPSILRHYDR
jgi:MFS family permease